MEKGVLSPNTTRFHLEPNLENDKKKWGSYFFPDIVHFPYIPRGDLRGDLTG